MTAVTWARVEAGKPVRELTYSGVDTALEWHPGSAEATLSDGQPTPLTGSGRRSGGDRRRDLTPSAPEDAIERDPALSTAEKEVLLVMLRHLRHLNSPPA